MDCDAIRPNLMAMLDGELTQPERQVCEAHLETCRECSQIATEYRAIQAAPPPPEEFDVWPDVQAQIAPDIQTQSLLAEMRLMREEMRALSQEVTQLRQALKQAAPSPGRSTALDLPYIRKSTHSPFQLV